MVSQPVTLECDITLDVNITARVDIVWKKDGLEFSRLERVSGHSVANGGIQYRVSYSIDMVAIEDHNVVYQCGMVINTRVIASNNLTLIVNCKSSCALLVNVILIFCMSVFIVHWSRLYFSSKDSQYIISHKYSIVSCKNGTYCTV